MTSRTARAFEWLWRGRALAAARDVAREATAADRARLDAARTAYELGNGTRNGRVVRDALEPALADALAIGLYREAAWRALQGDEESDRRTAYDARVRGLDEGGRARAWTALFERTFVETAALDAAEVRRDADAAAHATHALIEARSQRVEGVATARFERVSRVGVCALIVLLAIALVPALRRATRRDLARDAVWHSSSAIPGAPHSGRGITRFDPACDCFFHTAPETAPWIEFDLGREVDVSEVTVTNRTDCCDERALPLVVETRSTRGGYSFAARRDAPFGAWTVDIPTRSARYVRLLVPRATVFHLGAVQIR